MDVEMAKSKLREVLPLLRERFKVKSIGVFGSYVRGEQKEGSDLDVLVEFEDDAKLSLLDVAGLEIELSDLLGVNVDLVEKRDLKPYIGERILSEVIYA
jgi:hypothetical protein